MIGQLRQPRQRILQHPIDLGIGAAGRVLDYLKLLGDHIAQPLFALLHGCHQRRQHFDRFLQRGVRRVQNRHHFRHCGGVLPVHEVS
ncbi:hypothetical protein XACJK2_1320002 [Xanthomonas citri pv. citri]|nr:hypothetical protein XACJK2_1320002 [Xanthomonas citri pv. citri]